VDLNPQTSHHFRKLHYSHWPLLISVQNNEQLAWGRSFNINVNKISESSEYFSELVIGDVQLQVAGEQSSGGKSYNTFFASHFAIIS
jgi:hypothetical protein